MPNSLTFKIDFVFRRAGSGESNEAPNTGLLGASPSGSFLHDSGGSRDPSDDADIFDGVVIGDMNLEGLERSEDKSSGDDEVTESGSKTSSSAENDENLNHSPPTVEVIAPAIAVLSEQLTPVVGTPVDDWVNFLFSVF